MLVLLLLGVACALRADLSAQDDFTPGVTVARPGPGLQPLAPLSMSTPTVQAHALPGLPNFGFTGTNMNSIVLGAGAGAMLLAAHGMSGGLLTAAPLAADVFKALSASMDSQQNVALKKRSLELAEAGLILNQAEQELGSLGVFKGKAAQLCAVAGVASALMNLSPAAPVKAAGLLTSTLSLGVAAVVQQRTQELIRNARPIIEQASDMIGPVQTEAANELTALQAGPAAFQQHLPAIRNILLGLCVPALGYALMSGALVLKINVAAQVASALAGVFTGLTNAGLGKTQSKINKLRRAITKINHDMAHKGLGIEQRSMEYGKANIFDMTSHVLSAVESLNPSIAGLRAAVETMGAAGKALVAASGIAAHTSSVLQVTEDQAEAFVRGMLSWSSQRLQSQALEVVAQIEALEVLLASCTSELASLEELASLVEPTSLQRVADELQDLKSQLQVLPGMEGMPPASAEEESSAPEEIPGLEPGKIEQLFLLYSPTASDLPELPKIPRLELPSLD